MSSIDKQPNGRWRACYRDKAGRSHSKTFDRKADAQSYERHRRAATVLTSNRDTSEWLALMADPLLAQSAIDRLTSAAWELVIEGESYRKREKPPLTPTPPPESASTPRPRRGRRS